jgi:hypothetical protein
MKFTEESVFIENACMVELNLFVENIGGKA